MPEPVASDDEPHQPVDRKGEHAEEQVARHPGVPPHPDVPPSVRVLQGGVHPLHAGALPVAHAVVADVARAALRHRLPGQTRLERRVAAGVGVDDRHPPRHAGVGADLPRVADRVHEPVAVVHPLRGHPRQRDGGLAVVERRGRQDAAHRDVPVGRVDMRSVPAPALFVPLRVPPPAEAAGPGRPGHHLPRGHAAFQLPPGRVGSLTGPSLFLGRPRLRFGFGAGLGFATGLSRPTIAVQSLDTWPTTDPSYAALTRCHETRRRLPLGAIRCRGM